jgi:uncharacterized protein (DUF58 family)
MAISGFFGKINLSKIDLNIKTPEEIYAGKFTPITVELKNNKKFFPVILAKINFFGSNGVFLFTDKKSKNSIVLGTKFEKRGIYKIDKILICSVFPFNFFTRCKKLEKNLEILVFPEPKQCKYFSNRENKKKTKGENISKKTGYEDELISIRDYKVGDPTKYISWKATAKTDKLKTKELSSSSFDPVLIDFQNVPYKNLEDKISCITFLILDLYKKGIPFGLKIDSKIYKPDLSKSHKIKLLKELARYGLEK